MKRGLSVRWRLTLVYTLTAVITSAVLLGGVYALVKSAHTPSGMMATVGTDPGSFQQLPIPQDGSSVMVGPDGTPLVISPDSTQDLVGVTWGELVVQATDSAVDNTLSQLLWWSAAGLLALALVSVGVGWLFAGRMLAPVHTITSRARRISADSLDERVSLGGPRDELRELADTFDSMLDRMQGAFEHERRLVATMSHELRTPLANQRAVLDVALADPEASVDTLRLAAEQALGQTDRANRTIDALLTLARVQSGGELPSPSSVDLTALVADAIEQPRAGASAQKLTWREHLGPVTVAGNPELLERAVANVIGNAAAHNTAGGWVEATLDVHDGQARLVVANSGPDVPRDSIAGLTLPFRRGSHDRIGSHRGVGLGLSIVQAVVDQHQGRLELIPLEGGGLSVSMTLPAAPA